MPSKVDMEQFPLSRSAAAFARNRHPDARRWGRGAHPRRRPETDEDLRAIVRSVIERIQKENQLDNAPLTMRDLSLIADSFVATLRGTYHPRIQYPAAEPPAAT
jgi:hypothetical protein